MAQATYKSINIATGAAGGSDDRRLKVSTDDAVAGFLEEKTSATSGKITLTVTDPAANEILDIDVDESNVDHDLLLNYDIDEHRLLDDASTTTTSLWSSSKIQTELDGKVNAATPMTDNKLVKSVGTTGVDIEATAINVDDSNNVTGINDLEISGNLTVNGNTTTVNTSTLDVEDANITLNKGGNQSSADLQGAGLTVDMSDATNAQIAYDSSLESKFKVGEVGSESEIVTVNDTQVLESKTIDATSATGTNSISMDSDDVSYNNTVSGLFSNNVKEALDELNERDLFRQYHLYEDNALAFADADPGVIDPTGLDRDGWYYTNQNSGDKINWYYFDGTTQGTVTLGETSAYAVMEFDSAASTPILAIYTFPTGSGDIFPGFAHSRAVYSEPATPSIVSGQKYVVYFGENPNVHPELPRIELTYSSVNSIGDLDPSEPVLTISFGSSSSEPVGDVQYMVQELGIYSDPVKHNVELRIKKANESDLQAHINSTQAHAAIDVTYDNSSSGLVATDAQAAIDEVEDRLDTAESTLTNHLNTDPAKHNADQINYTNTTSGLVATDVQAAIDEVNASVDSKLDSADFDSSFDTRLALKDTDDLSEGVTNLYHTDERAQDAVGTILTDTASIDFTYNDAGNQISADVLPAGVDHDQLANFVSNEHIDHSSVNINTNADSGLAGGGDITTSRSLSVDIDGTTEETSADDADTLLMYDNSALALRKVSRGNLLSGLPLKSTGDINETSFAGSSGAASAPVTGLAFTNGSVRSFAAQVSVVVDATVDLYEEFEIHGIQRGADWVVTVESTGDDTSVDFNIDNTGQIVYTSPAYAGFVSMDIRYRAKVTGV